MVFGADKKLVPQVEQSSPDLAVKGLNSYGNMMNAGQLQSNDVGGAMGGLSTSG